MAHDWTPAQQEAAADALLTDLAEHMSMTKDEAAAAIGEYRTQQHAAPAGDRAGYYVDDLGEHRWVRLGEGRLDVGIIASDGDPAEHAARFLEALGPDPGEVHIDVTVYNPSGYHQPGCASGTWLTGTLVGRIADGLGCPPTLFASEPLNHWAHVPDLDAPFQVSYRRLDP